MMLADNNLLGLVNDLPRRPLAGDPNAACHSFAMYPNRFCYVAALSVGLMRNRFGIGGCCIGDVFRARLCLIDHLLRAPFGFMNDLFCDRFSLVDDLSRGQNGTR